MLDDHHDNLSQMNLEIFHRKYKFCVGNKLRHVITLINTSYDYTSTVHYEYIQYEFMLTCDVSIKWFYPFQSSFIRENVLLCFNTQDIWIIEVSTFSFSFQMTNTDFKSYLHIQINILQCKKGCLHSPNFFRPSTQSRSMEPDGNRNELSKMLPFTMRSSNVQNKSIPNVKKTNFHLPTFKRSKDETDWSLHWLTTNEVGKTCLTYALETPTSKNVNSMVQFKNTKRSTSNDIWTKFVKRFQKKERGS